MEPQATPTLRGGRGKEVEKRREIVGEAGRTWRKFPGGNLIYTLLPHYGMYIQAKVMKNN